MNKGREKMLHYLINADILLSKAIGGCEVLSTNKTAKILDKVYDQLDKAYSCEETNE